MQDTASLKIAVHTSDISKANTELNKLTATAGRTEKATLKTTSSFNKFNGVLTAGAVTLAIHQYIKLADTMTGMKSKLRLVTGSTEELITVQKELFKISQKTHQGYSETADVYSNFALSMGEMGKSQKEILRVTETVNKAIAISGGTAQQAAAATMQLGQAFASGTLRGDELNSILENSKGLAKAIADGMGVPIGKLRELGSEGAITAEILANALEKSASIVDAKFAKVELTVGMAGTNIHNSMLSLVGDVDNAMNGAGGIAQMFMYFSNLMDDNHVEIIETGQDIIRVFQLMGTAAIGLAAQVTAVFLAIPTALAMAFDNASQSLETDINNMIGGVEGAWNSIQSLYGGEASKMGRVSIATDSAKGLKSAYSDVLGVIENVGKTQSVLFDEVVKNTTTIKKETVDLDKKTDPKVNGAKQDAATAKTKKAKVAAIKDVGAAQAGVDNEEQRRKEEMIDSWKTDLERLNDSVASDYAFAYKMFDGEVPKEFFDYVKKEYQDLEDNVSNIDLTIDLFGVDDFTDSIASLMNGMGDLSKVTDEYHKNKIRYANNAKALADNEQKFQQDQIAGYGDMTGALIGFTEEGSSAHKLLLDAQMGFFAIQMAMKMKEMTFWMTAESAKSAATVTSSTIGVVAETTATATKGALAATSLATTITTETAKSGLFAGNALLSSMIGLPFPLNMVAFGATAAVIGGIMSSFMGGGAGAGGTPELTDKEKDENKRADIEASYLPITDRLDRQIALLESLNLMGSASVAEMTLGGVNFNRSKEMLGVDVSSYTHGTSRGDVLSTVNNLRAPVSGGRRDPRLDRSYAEEVELYTKIMGDAAAAISDYSTTMVDTISMMKDSSDSFKEMYDDITGTTKYADSDLAKAQEDVNRLRGDKSFTQYLETQISEIDKVNAALGTDVKQLLLSTDLADLPKQAAALAQLEAVTGQAFDNGVEGALNYIDSIELVAESMAKVTAERADLQETYDLLMGVTTQRKIELESLDESNRALQESIWAEEDRLEALELEKEALEKMKDYATSLLDIAKELRGETASGKMTIDQLSNSITANMADTMSKVLAGQEVGDNVSVLKDLISQYSDTARGSFSTQGDYDFAIAQLASRTEALANYISPQGFASGGYTGNIGKNRIAGVVHGQEYVVNAQTTKDLGLNGSGGIFKDLLNEVRMLKQLNIKLVADNAKMLQVDRAILSYQEVINGN